MNVLWLVGEPGVGKTTLSRLLLGKDVSLVTKPKWTDAQITSVSKRIVAAGHYTGDDFDGANTVSYSGVADALDFWLDNYSGYDLTIFDGDRFSFKAAVGFFQKRVSGHRLVCAALWGPNEAKARRLARGSKQNETWLKGRSTKSRNFFNAFEGPKIALDASRSPAQIHAVLKKFLETL